MAVARLPLLLLSVWICLPTEHASAQDVEPSNDVRQRVAELIEQLGAPEYIARKSAEIELKEIGLPAFDQVLTATGSADPEVAAASKFLLSNLAIEWSSPDDPPAIRGVMEGYGAMEERERMAVVDAIVTRAGQAQVGLRAVDALCRIVRFDPSPAVSRRAAGAAIGAEAYETPTERIEAVRLAQQRLDAEHGPSRRESSRWLNLFVTPREPAEALAAWRGLVDAESRKLAEDPERGDTSALIVLEWRRLRLELMSGDENAAATVARIVTLVEQELGAPLGEKALGRAFDWMLAAEADAALDQVIAARELELETKWGRYLLAMVRDRQGKEDEAERLADAALKTPFAEVLRGRGGSGLDGHLTIAQRLRLKGYADWAHAEYRQVIDGSPPLSPRSVYARHSLADSLQDHAYYEQAAETLTSLLTEIDTNDRGKQDYNQIVEAWGSESVLSLKQVESKRDYCQALAYRKAGDEAAARASLAKALQNNAVDADVLIAMYRSPGAERSYRKEVVRRIRELAWTFESDIESSPGDHKPLNQWAWLVGNTEGDYEQAVVFSERSLRLKPDDPGYQDTLASCYFSVGRVQEAVEMQRRAVAQLPHMQVMQRQLAEFEAALPASDSTSGE